eukprot:1180755-Prorocentrum_minimum.AAC.3
MSVRTVSHARLKAAASNPERVFGSPLSPRAYPCEAPLGTIECLCNNAGTWRTHRGTSMKGERLEGLRG